jgi:hypothetical protein
MSTVAVSGTAIPSSGHSTNVAFPLPSVGILVYSLSLQLQYVNRRALDLIGRLGQSVPRVASIVRSAQVLDLRDLIRERLNDRLDAEKAGPFEVSRSLPAGEGRLVLRGIGCPDRSSSQNSRIIILLEEISPESDAERGYAVSKGHTRQ